MRTGLSHLDQPEIHVGSFTLRPSYAQEPDRVWIEQPDGSGGDFDVAKLEKVISAFFAEHY